MQSEITEPTRNAVSAWIKKSALNSEDFLFPSRIQESPHLSTCQYARIVDSWVQLLGLDTTSYGIHTLRRTKATLIYRRTKNLRAVQLLLGHSKLESTDRYLGIEVDDVLEMESKLTCDHTAPVGDRGRRPANSGNSVGRNDPSEAAVQQGDYAATLRRTINSLSAP
jgi:hypothetical protein